MSEEITFRVVFWILLLFLFVFNRLVPALRANQSGQKLMPDHEAEVNEEKITFALRLILGLLIMAFLIVYAIYPSFMDRIHFNLPAWLRWLGVIITTLGLIFWIYSQRALDRYWSPQLQFQKQHKLVIAGPYRSVRHPIYSAMFVWVVGLAIFTANAGFALLAVLTIYFLNSRVPKEELMMTKQFGEEYERYVQNTGKFFPKFRWHF
jgi:protein-S-isoprenylcysteine O-methyltransferase Ste14